MKIALTIKEGWAETKVILDGDKGHVEKVVEAIKQAFKTEPYTEIK